MRPLSGESLWEVWERAGNYFPPILLLVLMGFFKFSWKGLFSKLKVRKINLTTDRLNNVELLSRMALFLLLAGHAGFLAFEKKIELSEHFSFIGLPGFSHQFLTGVGLFEFVLAFMSLTNTRVLFFLFVLVWKIFCELLYPISSSLVDILEFIERFGDYGIPLSIICILKWRKKKNAPLNGNGKSRELSFFRNIFYSGIGFISIFLILKTIIYHEDDSFQLEQLKKSENKLKTGHVIKPETEKTVLFKESSFHLLNGERLINELKKGGNVIFFRHFATDYRKIYLDKGRIRHGTITTKELLESCDQQRPLSHYGRLQAKSVGYGIRKLNIPVGDILTSPYCRVVEGTRIVFENRKYMIKRNLIYRAVDYTKSMMNQYMLDEVSRSFEKNKVIFSHRTQMDDIAYIDEGEAFVLKILPEGKFNLIGIVKPEEWMLATLNPDIFGLGRIQENIFSKKANSDIVDRDQREFEKQINKLNQ